MAEQWLLNYAQELDAGIALANERKWLEAIEKYDAAIVIADFLSPAFINRGLALHMLKRFDEALVELNRAAEMQPDLGVIYSNRSVIYREMGLRDASVADCERAIELAGDRAIDGHAYGIMATYYFESADYKLALQYYEKANELQPDNAVNRWNYGMCLLLQGDLARGWSQYHWRWQEMRYAAGHRSFPVPMWLGQEALMGKTLLLQAEQGFGDQIQFCRYANMAAAQGAQVLLEVRADLTDLCKSLAGASQVFAINDPLPSFDFYCPLMSLPLAFNTTLSTIPSPTAYLRADPHKVKKWQASLGIKTRLRVGIVWSSDPNLSVGFAKTIPLKTFSALLSEEFEFYSLQRNLWHQESGLLASLGIRQFGEELVNFSDTAALCDCMDLVISVDTSVAHLAGALGKPVCILLHANPDWRWLLNRSDSPWYSCAKLFRQKTILEWEPVLEEVKAYLLQLQATSMKTS